MKILQESVNGSVAPRSSRWRFGLENGRMASTRMKQAFDLKKLKTAAAAVAREHGLVFVVLFGSHATGHAHKQSDIDIAVSAKNSLGVQELIEISDEFGQKLDAQRVEVVDLEQVPPLLMKQVAFEGELLYEQTRGDFARFEMYAFKIYVETKPLRELQKARRESFFKNIGVVKMPVGV